MGFVFILSVLVFAGCVGPREDIKFQNYDAAVVRNQPAALSEILPLTPVPAGEAVLSFFALGDTGSGNKGQALVAEQMALTAAVERPKLVLFLGDNFYGHGIASVNDKQWKTKFENVYDRTALDIPFYAVLGNEDYRVNHRAEIEYARTNKRWRMQGRYYTFEKTLADGTRVQFFALDSVAILRGKAAEQLEWLEHGLRTSTADWKIAFAHHPLYSGVKGFKKEIRSMRNPLEKLFIKYNLDLYIAAHNHSIQIFKEISGVRYITSGAGSRPKNVHWTDSMKFAHADLAFVGVRIYKSRAEVYVINGRAGGLLFTDSFQKKAQEPKPPPIDEEAI